MEPTEENKEAAAPGKDTVSIMGDMAIVQEVLSLLGTLKTISTFGNGQTDLANLLQIGTEFEKNVTAFIASQETLIAQVKQITGGDFAAFQKQFPDIFAGKL